MATARRDDRRTDSGRAGAADPRAALIFAVVCAGFVMSNLDLTVVNVAFPDIHRSFHGSSLADLSWALNGYSIVYAALLVVAGRLADRTSRKWGFLLGVAVFTAGSAACAASQGVTMLVAARIVQAAGGAVMVPTSLGLLLAAYPPARRPKAIASWAAVGGVAAALGPIVAGVLVNVSWRWVFTVNVPVGIAALLVGRWVLPRDRGASRDPLPDVPGAIFVIAGIGLMALALVEAPGWGWGSARVIGCLVAAAAIVAYVLFRSSRHPSPVISVGLLRVRSFASANVSSFFFGTCFSALLLSFTLWCQDAWGWSALKTGLALAPGTLLMPFATKLAPRITCRYGNGAAVAVGTGCQATGLTWWLAFAHLHPNYTFGLLPGVALTMVGTALGLTALISSATRDLPAPEYAAGSAINTMVRQVGFVIGVSAVIDLLAGGHTPAAVHADFQHAWVFCGFCAALATASSLALLDRWWRRPVPPVVVSSAPVAVPVAAVPSATTIAAGQSAVPAPAVARSKGPLPTPGAAVGP